MPPQIVSPSDWLAARRALLEEEKALTRARDALAARRRALPWARVATTYHFDGPEGRESLAELFAGRAQLMVYHFMFGPDDAAGCPSCSLIADSYDRLSPHLAARDVSFVTVSRAPLAKIRAFQHRMGWTFKWVSSHDSNFNRDFKVTFSRAELDGDADFYNFGTGRFPVAEAPGLSVFARDADGAVCHTYSTYSRGLDQLIGVYPLLDLAPHGRDEGSLPMSMAWIRHRDAYSSS